VAPRKVNIRYRYLIFATLPSYKAKFPPPSPPSIHLVYYTKIGRPKVVGVYKYFIKVARLPRGKQDRIECLFCSYSIVDNAVRKQDHLKYYKRYLESLRLRPSTLPPSRPSITTTLALIQSRIPF